MATPSSLQADVDALTTLARRDLTALWREVSDAAQARESLADVLPAIVATYGVAAAAVAADWYDDLRAKQGIPGRFTALPAELPEALGTGELARWGVDPLFRPEPDWDAARTLVAGGMDRRIRNMVRDTITGSSLADPKARGWQRTGSGSSCAFCAMLIGRGAVYTEASVDFASHDHCNCSATPAWVGRPLPVKPFTPSQRRRNEETRRKDNARVRDWIADNPDAG